MPRPDVGIGPLPPAGFTGVGSLPGEDIVAALGIVFGESPQLPWLPELPARGPGADMIGRTMAAVSTAVGGLAVDLQPAGWRLVGRPGLDARRAMDLLTGDVDALLAFGDFDGTCKLQLTGPWTLAAHVDLPRGGPALGDRGAVRDLSAALAEAAAAHLAEVARRLPAARLVLQIDEPSIDAVLGGRVPTESGRGRHTPVPESDVTAGLRGVVDAAGVPVVIHCCAATPPLSLLADAGAAGVPFDATRLTRAERLDEESLGTLVERGVQLWLGVLPSLGPGAAPPPRAVADPVRRLWHSLGFPAERLAGSVVLTPACGQAGASIGWVRESLRLLGQAAKALAEAPEVVRS